MNAPQYLYLTSLVLSTVLFPNGASAQSGNTDDAVQEVQRQLNDLRDQMTKLQARLDQLRGNAPAAASNSSSQQGQQAGTVASTELPQQVAPSQSVGQQTGSYAQLSEDTGAAPRYDNAPLDPKYQGFFRLPGTDDILKIGGYFKTDFIHDLKPAGNTDSFIPSSFPVPQVSGVYNSTVSVRPTRLSLDFRVPTTQIGEARFYVEADLFGTNATTPRLRHAYAQAWNFLIGQTFSNFMDPDGFPDTLDFQGPNGMVNLRNPQLRYGVALHSGTTLYFSVEKASSDVLFTTPQFSAQPNAPTPDGVIRIRQEFERGHVQLAAIFRDVAAFLPSGKTDSVFGWGINASTGVRVFGKDNVIFAVAAGHGISRYLQDTSGLGIDAEPISSVNPHLEATPAVGVEAAFQHYWLKNVRSSAVYSYAAVDNTNLEAPSTYNHATYTAANLIWNPFGSLNLGSEFLYGWKVLQNGKKANDPRVQFSAKFNFVRIKSE